MKRILTSLIITLALFSLTFGQTIIKRDPVIADMVENISAERIEASVNKLVSFQTRHNMSQQDNPEKGIGAAWSWIKGEAEKSIPSSQGRLSVEYVTYSTGGERQRIPVKTELRNVVATLKGVDPSDTRVLIMLAHFDSRVEGDSDFTNFAPGANDDGSGVASMLELVRIMAPQKFSATIKFIFLSGEEHGLLGAKHMAALAKTENWNIVAVLNNDMIGNSLSSETLLNDNMRVRVFSEGVPLLETDQMAALRRATAGENDGKARQLARYVKEVGERYVDQMTVTLVYRNDRFGRGGDHTPFAQEGFTAVRITEFNENYDRTHKTPEAPKDSKIGDLPEGVDFEYVRKNSGVNLSTFANLALSPNVPLNVSIHTAGMSNTTKLTWETPAGGPAVAGYYVLLRETYQPLWEKKIWVTGNSVTLPYSKDNYFFAVQSVDAGGHESLAVFPAPARR